LRNASLFVLPMLTLYFLWKRAVKLTIGLWLALPFVAGAVFNNAFPFVPNGDTILLSALHLPIALWFAVGVAYLGGRSFAGGTGMEFVRFSGELFIYYALIAAGGGVFTGFTMMMFLAIGIKADWLAQDWIVPCGAAGAVIIGSWLVEAKQSVIENMAPVLEHQRTTSIRAVCPGTLASLPSQVLTGASSASASGTSTASYAVRFFRGAQARVRKPLWRMTVKVEADEVFDGLPGANGGDIPRPHEAPEIREEFNIHENAARRGNASMKSAGRESAAWRVQARRSGAEAMEAAASDVTFPKPASVSASTATRRRNP